MGSVKVFGFIPDVWDIFVHYCIVEDISEGSYSYQPKVFQVTVGYSIRACGSCGFGAVYCCFEHAWGKRRVRLGERSYSVVVLSDCVCEVFGDCVDVYDGRERAPICSVVVSAGALV